MNEFEFVVLGQHIAHIHVHEMQIPGAMYLDVRLGDQRLEIMTSADLRATTVVLYQLHVEGLSAGALGPGLVRGLGQALAQLAGAYASADYVGIIGGYRTTGARPYRYPKPRVFKVLK